MEKIDDANRRDDGDDNFFKTMILMIAMMVKREEVQLIIIEMNDYSYDNNDNGIILQEMIVYW